MEVKQSGPWIGKLSPMLYGKLVLIPRSAHNALSLTWPPRRQEGSSSFPLHSMHKSWGYDRGPYCYQVIGTEQHTPNLSNLIRHFQSLYLGFVLIASFWLSTVRKRSYALLVAPAGQLVTPLKLHGSSVSTVLGSELPSKLHRWIPAASGPGLGLYSSAKVPG